MSGLCDKIACLGKRQSLETKKMELFDWITFISEIDFENSEEFTNKLNIEGSEYKALAHMYRFIREHRRVVGTDELLVNINKGLGMLEVARRCYKEWTDIIIKMQQLALTASDGSTNSEQRAAGASRYAALKAELTALIADTKYQGYSLISVSADVTINTQVGYTATNILAIIFANGNTAEPADATGDWAVSTNAQADITKLEANYQAILVLQGDVEEFVDRLQHKRNSLVDTFKQNTLTLEIMRGEAIKRLNKMICNTLKQIAYLNVCIHHNGYY